MVMNCDEIQEILSVFYDGELTTDQKISVELHLESCSECATKLTEMESLSQLTSSLLDPVPPRQLWKKIETNLNSSRDASTSNRRRKWLRSPATLIVATITILVVTGLAIYLANDDHADHDYLAEYWQTFESNPSEAQKQLLNRYPGQEVLHNKIVKQVGYRPLTSIQVPETVIVDKTYLLDMPCCKCIQTICRRADGSVLTVFEHDEEQAEWFHGRPQIKVQCKESSCCVTELKTKYAASWKVGPRMVTIIGLKNIEELNQWVNTLGSESN